MKLSATQQKVLETLHNQITSVKQKIDLSFCKVEKYRKAFWDLKRMELIKMYEDKNTTNWFIEITDQGENYIR